jgi:hypothetical protein
MSLRFGSSRKSMQETAAITLFGILCLAVFGQCWTTTHPAAAGRGGIPVVMVTQDIERHVLTISGSSWGIGKPQVRLGTQSLPVERYSADEIVAHLPDGIEPALYVLTVATDSQSERHDTVLYTSGS